MGNASAKECRGLFTAVQPHGCGERLTAWLDQIQQFEEAWFLGLRLVAGVSLSALKAEFGAEALEPTLSVVENLVEDKLLIRDGDCVRLTDRGRLISNDVFEQFLGLHAQVGSPA